MRAGPPLAVLALACVAVLGAGPAGAQAATGSVSGTVTSADGEPLEGVCVQVSGEEPSTVTTDATGRYTADGLAPGDHLVGFNTCEDALSGQAAEYWEDARGFGDADLVRVEEGAAVTGIDAELAAAAVISGTVTDDGSAAPLEGVCVLAIEVEDSLFGFARTDADGAYALDTLHGGEYLLLFTDCGDPYNHQVEAYDDFPLSLPLGLDPTTEPATVTVADGERADGVDAALTEGGSLRGSVTALHTGRPANGVCVALFAADGGDEGPVGGATTGFLPDRFAPGDYVLPGLVPGDYVVGFNPDVCADDGYDESWALSQDSRDSASVLTVEQGQVTEGVDAVVAPRPSIRSVCFSDGSGSPFSDVPDDSVHAPAIECVASYDIAAGRADGSYGPGELVRRDQMATFVARTLRALEVELPTDPPDAFVDDGGSVHAPAIDQLAALGIVTGKGGGRYAPADPVSRGQMTAFLVRAYEEATGFALLAPQSRFSDDDGTSHEASIDRAATAGLTAGADDGRFRPGDAVPRDQMATFAARLLDRVERDVGSDGFLFFTSVSADSPSSAGALHAAQRAGLLPLRRR